MIVSHHLTDETLQDYAVGSLGSALETLVACHLTVCRQCREKATLADNVGGELFEQFDSVPVSYSVADILKQARQTPSTSTQAPNKSPYFKSAGVPKPLARLLPARLEELDWRRIAPGIKQINLTDQPRRMGAFKLLHLSPGVVLSAHSHNDRELTYVVKGSYQDEIGRFKAGDIADLDGTVAHQPVVDTHEPCIALIASLSPVKYNGMLGKIMQPFVGI
ncbi:MAG: putative transcriptional regulator [Granulosicoccus sp.]|jgi:putative transcriptional regulator